MLQLTSYEAVDNVVEKKKRERKMKRYISFLLALCMCAGLLLNVVPGANAAKKDSVPRTIGIVFDNSGSMYMQKNTAWCRATYAMEVFASMLNEGDKLMIYPMWPIMVNGNEYTMNQPLTITSPEQASDIRAIQTPMAGGTPVESITAAHEDMQGQSGECWLIILTDGDVFYANDEPLDNDNSGNKKSKAEVERLLVECSADMNALYLGIGAVALEPECEPAGQYKLIAEKATRSEDVLARLTSMCNMIFGRDTMPSSHFENGIVKADVSMTKMIVFVQGEEISDVSLVDGSGNCVGTKVSEAQTRYATDGCTDTRYSSTPDTALQGMIVTYEDCPIGEYKLSCNGTVRSTEIYYEPNVDVAFTFTDAAGNKVDPNSLYEGDYTISYGMVDGVTGEYTSSDLLGTVEYDGHYYVNGETYDIKSNEKSGSQNIHLGVGDSFDADITVTYLGGYKIYKDGSSFGWPDGGISVSAKPAGELKLVISGGSDVYELSKLDEGENFRAEVYYEGTLLTADELEKVELTWDSELSGALVEKDHKGDYYELVLSHKKPDDPQATPLGDFSFPITAIYTPPASETAESAPVQLSYTIEDNTGGLAVKLTATQDYFVISEIAQSDPIRADITKEGVALSAEEFAALTFTPSCNGLTIKTEALPQESAYLLYIEPNDNYEDGEYVISAEAMTTDDIGRVCKHSDKVSVALSTMALWLKWVIGLSIAFLLLLILLVILHIKALPKKLHITKRDSSMSFDGEDVTKNATFDASLSKKRVDIYAKYAGKKIGLVMDVKPAKGSYVKTRQVKRAADVMPLTVKKMGNAVINEAMIGTVRYVYDEDTRKFERMPKSDKPFTIRNGTRISYSGIIQSNGENKNFNVVTKLNFKKRK